MPAKKAAGPKKVSTPKKAVPGRKKALSPQQAQVRQVLSKIAVKSLSKGQ